ncbi:hypothetical protein Sjap_002219 [Stephania japonica]|uniref:Uncharacterized protein n=1 Tax=Stephania japonica TaxID=461633 RepID=A0AAP0KNT9_9MAGN
MCGEEMELQYGYTNIQLLVTNLVFRQRFLGFYRTRDGPNLIYSEILNKPMMFIVRVFEEKPRVIPN